MITTTCLTNTEARNLDIFTIALYHSHESYVTTLCINTIESSSRSVLSSNEHSKKYFVKAIEKGDLKSASLWSANGGRSFAHGKFTLVNASEIDAPHNNVSPDFYLLMVHALDEMRYLVEIQSSHGRSLLLFF